MGSVWCLCLLVSVDIGSGGPSSQHRLGWTVTQTPLQPSATIPGDRWSVRARGRDTCGEGPGEGFGVGAVA